MKRMTSLYLALVGSGVVLVPSVALAQFVATPVPTTDAVSQIEEIGTAVLAIGGALILAAALAVAVKWAKAAIFG
jgi:hypothetical protein